jgi:hypothetical protein
MPEVKTAATTTPPTATTKYEVVGSDIYLGTERHAVGDVIELTPSLAKRLGDLVKPAAAA